MNSSKLNNKNILESLEGDKNRVVSDRDNYFNYMNELEKMKAQYRRYNLETSDLMEKEFFNQRTQMNIKKSTSNM